MDDANECVLKNNSVTSRSCLNSVVAIGKSRPVLAVQVSMLGAKHKIKCKKKGTYRKCDGP
jgi:hypothetical protein